MSRPIQITAGLLVLWAASLGMAITAAAQSAPPKPKPAPAGTGNAFGGFAGRSDAPIDIASRRLEVDDEAKTAIFKGDVVAIQGDYILKTPELEVHYEGKAADAALAGGAAATPAAAGAATPAKDDGEAAAPGAAKPDPGTQDSGTQISRILAKGPVVVDGKDGQRLTGDAADYDVKNQAAVVRGNVVLIQGKTGQRATSDTADYDAANEIAVLKGNVVLTQGENIVKGDRLWVNFKTNESKLDTSAAATPAPGPDGKACPPGRVCLHFPGEQKK